MVKNYEKPVVLANDELAEGIYAASGEVVENTAPDVDTIPSGPADEGIIPNGSGAEGSTASDGGPKCDSIYMQGVYQAPDYSPWNGVNPGYKKNYGCLGCPAFTYNACGLQTHYQESGQAGSYDVDNGNRMPSWERDGHGPDDPVTF